MIIRDMRIKKRVPSKLWMLSGLGLCACAVWLSLFSLGCISEEGVFVISLWSYSVELEPRGFEIMPSQNYFSTAVLSWADQRTLKAQWSLGTNTTGILSSAEISPSNDGKEATVLVKTADRETLFGSKGIWTAGDTMFTSLPVIARFVDPVWASIGEQEVTLSRKGVISFNFSYARLEGRINVVIPTYEKFPEYEKRILRGLKFKGTASVVNAPPDWAFNFELKNRSPDGVFPEMVVTPNADGRSVTFQRTKYPTPATADMLHWREWIEVKAVPTVAGRGYPLEKEIFFQVKAYE